MVDPVLPSPMCSAALIYARRCWPVFPCRERSESYVDRLTGETKQLSAKSPYGGKGGLHKATTDERTIADWWRKWPEALIGLPMGGATGLFALDFDPRHDPDTGEDFTLDALKVALEAQMGVALPVSLASRTQSGGVHVFLRQPDDGGAEIRNRGNLPLHVDVRGRGGYVIAPPSRMADGAGYRWLHGRANDEAAAAPPELIAILRAPKARATNDVAGDQPAAASFPLPRASDDPAGEAVRKWGLAALDGECRALAAVPQGKRNIEINAKAFRLGQIVGAGALAESVVRAALQGVVDAMPNNGDPAGARQTIENGLSAGIAQPCDLSGVIDAARERAEHWAQRGERNRARVAGAAPHPVENGQGKPSSQVGDGADKVPDPGAGDRLTRECAMLPHTDLGNLERFLKRSGRDFLFVEQWGWLAWDGRRWNRDMAMPLLGRAVQETMRAIQDEAGFVRASGVPDPVLEMWDSEQKRAHELQQRGKLDHIVSVKRGVVTLFSDTIARWGRTSEGAGHISCIPKMTEARLSVRPDDFDLDPLIVNVGNGTLAFTRPEGGRPAGVTLRAHRRRDLITRIATVDYEPAAGCLQYDAFLARVQPEADMRTFLDAWAGYNMLGDASAQKMALFYGEGANGKGVWVNTHAWLLGDYSWAAAIETFIDQGRYKKGGEASPDMAALAGRRMVYANEPEENSKFSDGLIKAMTSDEPIGGVRELHKPPFQLVVTFKNTVSANIRPRIGTDHGIQRRMQIVPWGVIIPAEERDLGLKNRLKAEGGGILNRMVRGALAYLTAGLPLPDAVKEATQAYIAENDLLGQFLALCIERVPGATLNATALHELFAAWQTWAQLLPQSGKPWSAKHLAAQMEKKSFRKRKSSLMVWDDIAPRYDARDFTDEHGKPVERELPAPRATSSPPPPAPPMPGGVIFDDDDYPP